jgi:hypothetical protein
MGSINRNPVQHDVGNQTYEIIDDRSQGLHIKCLKCGKTSYDLGDLCNLWCGNCKRFHEDMMAEDEPPKQEPPKPLPGRGPRRKEGWRAVCTGTGRTSSAGHGTGPRRH